MQDFATIHSITFHGLIIGISAEALVPLHHANLARGRPFSARVLALAPQEGETIGSLNLSKLNICSIVQQYEADINHTN